MSEAEELRLQQLIRKQMKVALNSLELLELLRLSEKKKLGTKPRHSKAARGHSAHPNARLISRRTPETLRYAQNRIASGEQSPLKNERHFHARHELLSLPAARMVQIA